MNKFKDPTEAFEILISQIFLLGEKVKNTKVLRNVSFTIQCSSNPVRSVERKFNLEYAETEFQWYSKGDRDITPVSMASIWKTMVIPGTNEVNSNYGHYWMLNHQLSRAVDLLREDIDTRRAVVVHYDVHELDRHQYDTPCNVFLHFQYYDEKLNLSVFARSIDIVFGFCNDNYCFDRLLGIVSEDLCLDKGEIHWNISNLHVYERHYVMADRIVSRLKSTT